MPRAVPAARCLRAPGRLARQGQGRRDHEDRPVRPAARRLRPRLRAVDLRPAQLQRRQTASGGVTTFGHVAQLDTATTKDVRVLTVDVEAGPLGRVHGPAGLAGPRAAPGGPQLLAAGVRRQRDRQPGHRARRTSRRHHPEPGRRRGGGPAAGPRVRRLRRGHGQGLGGQPQRPPSAAPWRSRSAPPRPEDVPFDATGAQVADRSSGGGAVVDRAGRRALGHRPDLGRRADRRPGAAARARAGSTSARARSGRSRPAPRTSASPSAARPRRRSTGKRHETSSTTLSRRSSVDRARAVVERLTGPIRYEITLFGGHGVPLAASPGRRSRPCRGPPVSRRVRQSRRRAPSPARPGGAGHRHRRHRAMPPDRRRPPDRLRAGGRTGRRRTSSSSISRRPAPGTSPPTSRTSRGEPGRRRRWTVAR